MSEEKKKCGLYMRVSTEDQAIKSKKINTIVSLKLDRITRSIYDWENLILNYKKKRKA